MKHGRMALLGLLWLLLGACGSPAIETTPTVDPRVERGQAVFVQHCAACHAVTADTVIVGPSLAGIGERAGERVSGMEAALYLELSILAPEDYLVEGYESVMPSDFGKKLTGEELDELVAYLLTLR